MKKLGKKGFTLIELLAVVVILGVLLSIAIPSVSKYISQSRKGTYVQNAQSYVEAVKNETYVGNEIKFPVSSDEATVVTFRKLRDFLEKGGKKSPYGGDFDLDKSFVVIVNVDTAESPRYKYYIAAIDKNGYGIGESGAAAVIEYDSLSDKNILQLGKENGKNLPNKGDKIDLYSEDKDSELPSESRVTEVYDKITSSSES